MTSLKACLYGLGVKIVSPFAECENATRTRKEERQMMIRVF